MNLCYAEASNYLSTQSRGFFAVLVNQQQTSYRLRDLQNVLEGMQSAGDMYLSQASFNRPSRRLVNLHRIGLSFVDCETHKTTYRALTPEQQSQSVLVHCEDAQFPRPTLINHSGRGLHLKWAFDIAMPWQALPRWNAVQKQIITAFQPFGADKAARDGSRCLRMIGSINPRSGQEVRTVWAGGIKWDFDTFAREVLPMCREELQQKRQAKMDAKEAGTTRKCNLWQPKQLWWNRLQDVRKLIDLRGWTDGVPEGYRTHFLLVATCAVAWSMEPQDLHGEVEALATEFCPTLPLPQARSAMSSAIRQAHTGKPYRFTSARIVELLDIGREEQRQLKTLFDADERAACKKAYDAKRDWGKVDRETYEQQAQQRREQAQTLRAQGLTYSQIAAQMDTTANAIDKMLRKSGSALTL